jgi:predicted transcriptional regulator of viral defense system
LARQIGLPLPDKAKAQSLIRRLLASKRIAPIPRLQGVYRVVEPYAATLPVPEEVIVQEANPRTVFSFFTAMAWHDLTDDLPADIHATDYGKWDIHLPLGITRDDWIDVRHAVRRTVRQVGDRKVHWTHMKAEWRFGDMVHDVQGIPVYVTDLERTLVDSLRFPDKCGGIIEVFRAWKRASDDLNVDTLIEYIDKIGQAILRQRAGFILEQIGFPPDRFDEWAKRAVRGSSAKLVANRDFSSRHSSRWSLSINLPDSVIAELRDQ